MRKIYLSHDKKIIAGVCGGIAEAFKFDPIILRLIWIFAAMVGSFLPAIIVYLLAWAFLPNKPKKNVTDTAWSSE
ncbi:PspC domain-containing protein [Candidatus Campbellbacteria bacterium CG22_combo_CG10-13_8_21_14_all_36_13]|uniref:PspC domain-containing protein n=1 Tax=Candidatus Campbellbacteria bacterium CG22_combo_CG10-13_8_21_14_all_36_13 TaxID=1974529 RepID=A0A2H0DXM1_9BACT|nr:MAG: PspC domain-containing protein [Candidatus Campbellbacteria bacterium CG22_combo_CG10-13_8_21_14_all_36_13]